MKKGHYENITEQRFGKLIAKTFIKITYKQNRPFAWWKCVCDCGNKIIASSRDLKRGHKKSCGCLHAEIAKLNGLKRRKIGEEFALQHVYKAYKRRADLKKLSFELSLKRFTKLALSSCFYCGTVRSHTYKYKKWIEDEFKMNGVDRLNNLLGYTVKNSVSCCKNCNYAKREQSKEKFLNWIKEVYLHNFE